VSSKLAVSCGVSDHLLGVLAAIEFDHQLPRRAGKIGDALADRMLTAEFPWHRTFAERTPQNPFHIG
jgi:hypothetical protein